MGKLTENSDKADIFAAYEKSYGEVIALNKEMKTLKETALSDKQTILRLEGEKEAAEKAGPGNLTEIEAWKAESSILRQLFPNVDVFDENFLDDLAELSEEITKEPVTIVIPYVKEFAQGNELQMALRGWDTHFKEDFNVVVIGDREDWMNDLVEVIECERIGNNPPIDIAHKMLKAIESDLVSNKFIWANDDQYLVSPCVLSDFEILKCEGVLKAPFPNNLYGKNKQATLELLQKNKNSTWDYSTHTPFVFEKEKLTTLIEDFELTKNARLISCLYFNRYFPEFVPLKMGLETDNVKVGVYRPNANLGKLKQLIPLKKVVSNSQSGWSDQFAKTMQGIFSKKCRFEN